MKQILRSLFLSHKNDDPDLFFQNYLRFEDAGLSFGVEEEKDIWEFLQIFASSNNHVPEVSSLMLHFTSVAKSNVLDRLELLQGLSPLKGGDFEIYLQGKIIDRQTKQVVDLFTDASAILQRGLEVKIDKVKTVLKGPQDAVRYVMEHSHDIIKPPYSSRLSGDVTQDGADFLKEYQRVVNDPRAGLGQHTGIAQIDKALGGARKGELWTHAAFTGGLKSTFALNWMYNQAVYYHESSLLFSLEMPYPQVRRILYAIHSYNAKFNDIRLELGIQTNPSVLVGLEYKKIRDGKLSPNEYVFLQKVAEDFNEPQNDYGNIHIEVADPDQSDFRVMDVRSKAERIYNKSPFASVFIDHSGLMSPRKWVSSTTERINEVIRDEKKLAMTFNRGLAIPVISLFQINRVGYENAIKNEGRYSLTALAYANECEKSSDVVTSSYLDDDMRREGLVQFQNLKARDDEPFELFRSQVIWHCRRIKTFYEIDQDYRAKAPSPQKERPHEKEDLF